MNRDREEGVSSLGQKSCSPTPQHRILPTKVGRENLDLPLPPVVAIQVEIQVEMMDAYTNTHTHTKRYVRTGRYRYISFFKQKKKKCISRIRNGELRRARWQAAKAAGGRAEGGQAETGVLLGALLSNQRASPPANWVLGARWALHFILASSGAKIDIETEGSVCEAGGRRETGVLY